MILSAYAGINRTEQAEETQTETFTVCQRTACLSFSCLGKEAAIHLKMKNPLLKKEDEMNCRSPGFTSRGHHLLHAKLLRKHFKDSEVSKNMH